MFAIVHRMVESSFAGALGMGVRNPDGCQVMFTSRGSEWCGVGSSVVKQHSQFFGREFDLDGILERFLMFADEAWSVVLARASAGGVFPDRSGVIQI